MFPVCSSISETAFPSVVMLQAPSRKQVQGSTHLCRTGQNTNTKMKAIIYTGILCLCLMTSCNRSATVFDPPSSGQSIAVIINSTPAGVSAEAIDAVGYAFAGVGGLAITNFVEASGKVGGVRVEGSEETTDFKEVLAKLKKNKKLSECRIFYIGEGSSKRVEF